jgi:NAD(P)-dependent dehydrogenase (short-subunit alcohol dehydrogenase family)
MAGQYDGKVVLVTGASGGIGKATAIAFANEGREGDGRGEACG